MAPRLARTVWVAPPGKSQRMRLSAGSTPPEWAIPLITNRAAWAIPPVPQETVTEEPVDDSDAQESGVPPRHGPGSGREAWAEYAESHSVEFDEDAPRADIIAAIDDAGIPTEQE